MRRKFTQRLHEFAAGGKYVRPEATNRQRGRICHGLAEIQGANRQGEIHRQQGRQAIDEFLQGGARCVHGGSLADKRAACMLASRQDATLSENCMKSIERIDLGAPSLGSTRHLTLHRYGKPGARPKAYLQASLHADEIPPMLVQHHLIRLLDEADKAGAIRGEIVIVPVANPIGSGQVVNSTLAGRHDAGGGGNFNRRWPDLFEGWADRVSGKLGSDATANIAVVRRAVGESLAEMTATSQLARKRLVLARLAHDADFVLDLHCDSEALLHLYLNTAHWPEGSDLSAEIGSRATLICDDSGGGSLDQAFITPWTRLAEALGPKYPIPAACLGATIEYRGQADVSD